MVRVRERLDGRPSACALHGGALLLAFGHQLCHSCAVRYLVPACTSPYFRTEVARIGVRRCIDAARCALMSK